MRPRARKPNLHDRLCLLACRLASRKGRRYRTDEAKEFYDRYMNSDHILEFHEDLRFRLRNDEITRVVQRFPAATRVLDAGCGVGHILRILPAEFRRIGVDYSIHSLRLAKGYLSGSCEFANCSLYDLPFRNASADVVLCLEVLEHLEDDEGAAAEIARVLKPDGYLIGSVPCTHYFPEYLALMGHYRHYTPRDFEGLLSRHGLFVAEYLNQYPRCNAVYFYIRMLLEGSNAALCALTHTTNGLHSRQIPFSGRRLYAGAILPLLRVLRHLDKEPGFSQPSTFVLAQRRGGTQ